MQHMINATVWVSVLHLRGLPMPPHDATEPQHAAAR